MKLMVQAMRTNPGELQDDSDFEALKESLAASVYDADSAVPLGMPGMTEAGTDDAYEDFIRFVMKVEQSAQSV